MGKKNYSDEFKRDAVALYRDTDGATLASIAKDLGINDMTLRTWCKNAGVPIRHPRPGTVSSAPAGSKIVNSNIYNPDFPSDPGDGSQF